MTVDHVKQTVDSLARATELGHAGAVCALKTKLLMVAQFGPDSGDMIVFPGQRNFAEVYADGRVVVRPAVKVAA